MPGVITTTSAGVDAPQFVAIHQNDPLASPLIEELAVYDLSLPARDIGPHPFERDLVRAGLFGEGAA
jgi:hypothetical protein